MREIEFRGKAISKNDGIEQGQFVYGSLLIDKLGYTFILIPCIDDKDLNNDFWKCKYRTVEVDPDTVGQYTGLKDKNGKKVFEGDIVKIEASAPFCAFGTEFVGRVVFVDHI